MKKLIKSRTRNSKVIVLTFLMCFGFFSTAHAQVNFPGVSEIVRSINELRVAVVAKIDGVVNLYSDYILRLNPNQVPTVRANEAQATAQQAANRLTVTSSTLSTRNSLLRSGDRETLRLGDIPAVDATITPPPATLAFGPRRGPDIAKGNQSLNFDTLLTPEAYGDFDFTRVENNPAWNFIQLAGGLYQPVALELTPAQLEKVQLNPDYRKYRAAIRAYTAAQSVGASNLYGLMAERIPQENLGRDAGMSIQNASLLQLQKFMATRRSQNPNWYDQMATAPPATVQRETLFVLAEMREQLFQLQQQNERLLATISVMQLQQNNQSVKLNLIQLEQKVRDAAGVTTTPTPPSNLQIPGVSP